MAPADALTRSLAQDFLARYPGEAAVTLQALAPADAAGVLEDAQVEQTAAVLQRLSPDVAGRLLTQLPGERSRAVLAALDSSTAAGLMRRLGKRLDSAAFLASLPAPRRRELEAFMHYPDGTAGSLMDSGAPVFRSDTRAGDVEAAIRDSRRTGDLVVLVVDEELRLQGTVPMVGVLLADPDVALGSLGLTVSPTVEAFAHRDDVVKILDERKLSAIPVIDVHGRPVGVLRHRALASVAEEHAVGDMQQMVGASREERALSPVSFAVRKRLPWLQINLATAFLAASVVAIFEDTIAQFTALAVLLPVVAGQSGNTGAQSLAVTMRGLTLHEIGLRQWLRVVGKESMTGLLNGIAVAIVTVIGVYIWSGSAGLCLVIGLAMVSSMTIAGVAGAGVPLVLSAVGQDPAQSSSIVLTTVTDIMGFLSFLGLAALFSGLL